MIIDSTVQNPETSFLSLATIRDCLLSSQDRVLKLDEILEVSHAYYGGDEILSLYGMPPKDFYKRGIRILGRTAIECAIDAHSIQMAKSIKQMKDAFFPHEEAVFLDLFAGSGNSLYHAAQSLNSPISIGIEKNKDIYELTKFNLKIMGSDCQIHHGDSLEVIKTLSFSVNSPIIVFLAPPWGKGFSFDTGLNLLETSPPTDEIIKIVKETFNQNRLIFVSQIYEKLVRSSFNKIVDQFSYFSEETIPAISQGLNIGLLMCTNEKPFLQ